MNVECIDSRIPYHLYTSINYMVKTYMNLFNNGLSPYDIKTFLYLRIRLNLLLENPQMIIQIIYFEISNQITTVFVISLMSTVISLLTLPVSFVISYKYIKSFSRILLKVHFAICIFEFVVFSIILVC